MTWKKVHSTTLVFMRVRSPKELTSSTTTKNPQKKVRIWLFVVGQILRVRANQYVPINEVSAGDIIAFAGLKESGAGDTLSTSPDDDFILQPLNVP